MIAADLRCCASCYFWGGDESHEPNRSDSCQAHPPTMCSDGTTRFPQTTKNGWCGEWSAWPDDGGNYAIGSSKAVVGAKEVWR